MYRQAPRDFASDSLSCPRAMATVLKPILEANWTPRWPSPPKPSTATTSPGRAPQFRRQLNVVMPAHISGAASTADNSSGTRASASARAMVESAWPPSLVMPVMYVAVWQAKKCPRRQLSQSPQYPPFQPRPARWPGVHPATPAPTASTIPTTSCPGTRGYDTPGKCPSFVNESLWQIPQACTLIRTDPAPGSGISRSTISKGPPGLETCTARMFDILPPIINFAQSRVTERADFRPVRRRQDQDFKQFVRIRPPARRPPPTGCYNWSLCLKQTHAADPGLGALNPVFPRPLVGPVL